MKNQFMPKVVCYRFSDTAAAEPPTNCYAARLIKLLCAKRFTDVFTKLSKS